MGLISQRWNENTTLNISPAPFARLSLVPRIVITSMRVRYTVTIIIPRILRSDAMVAKQQSLSSLLRFSGTGKTNTGIQNAT